MGKIEVLKTDEITKEFLVSIINFIEKSINDAKTDGDIMLLRILTDVIIENIKFHK